MRGQQKPDGEKNLKRRREGRGEKRYLINARKTDDGAGIKGMGTKPHHATRISRRRRRAKPLRNHKTALPGDAVVLQGRNKRKMGNKGPEGSLRKL